MDARQRQAHRQEYSMPATKASEILALAPLTGCSCRGR